MTPAEMETKIAWLEALLRATIKRQNEQDKQLDYIHDRLLCSPPAGNIELFQDHVNERQDYLAEQMDTLGYGLSRLRADMPDSGRSVRRVSERIEELDRPGFPSADSRWWNPNLGNDA